MALTIKKYASEYETIWDEFVENNAVNGSFLQEWKFLNYHGKDKFEDCSIMVFHKEKLVAVSPACVVMEDGKKIYHSHRGSTYGGMIICQEFLRIDKIRNLFEEFEAYLKEEGFHKIILKMTMELLCKYPQDVIRFFLGYSGYEEEQELNIYIDYNKYDKEVVNNFSKMKKRNVKKCIDAGMELKKFEEEADVEEFHQILSKNLMKYNTKPVHSVSELLDLKERLGESVEFYGAYLDGKMLAGTMVFVFDNAKCAHTQYLAADLDFNHLNPMSFIYYKMSEMFCLREFRYLSWGTATEHGGKSINWGLANNKEEFGSLHAINSIFMKEI